MLREILRSSGAALLWEYLRFVSCRTTALPNTVMLRRDVVTDRPPPMIYFQLRRARLPACLSRTTMSCLSTFRRISSVPRQPDILTTEATVCWSDPQQRAITTRHQVSRCGRPGLIPALQHRIDPHLATCIAGPQCEMWSAPNAAGTDTTDTSSTPGCASGGAGDMQAAVLALCVSFAPGPVRRVLVRASKASGSLA